MIPAINFTLEIANGCPKGSGTAVFETPKDAQQTISMYHGFEWYGCILEVREDHFAGLTGAACGGFYGGLCGGLCGGFRDGMRGGFGGGPSHHFSNSELYTDYSGPNQHVLGSRMDNYGGGFGASMGYRGYTEPEPSQQIMVCNLPWSTTNEDLVKLFETMGQVELAEFLLEEGETAIAKFQQYMYGGQPLDIWFNDHWHTFTMAAAKGGVNLLPD
ncbi:MAG: hypothetical protein NXY57DRAFT_968909 [Lentinula lateritia]|nr:MAG: hypothetical protein NXY57DRAFT_968909 [Lentinula lateritia]